MTERPIVYIAKHADRAIALVRRTSGDHKADVLQSHATNAKQWAVNLGLGLPEDCSPKDKLLVRQETRNMAFLKKIENYLKTRLENIRCHIVKVADPELFLKEALLKLEEPLLTERVTGRLERALTEADPDRPRFTEEHMTQLVARMNAPVPMPRRNRGGERLRAAAARLEKLRAAAQALYVYAGLPLAHKTKFRGSLEKCHDVVTACLTDLEDEYDGLVKECDEKDGEGKGVVQLEDAWNHPMQCLELETEETSSAEDGPNAKRQKTDDVSAGNDAIVIRSRCLLTPGRNTFSSLLPALKRKKATLFRTRSASHVKLEFGNAFEMTIYFVPLLVAIRAIAATAPDEASSSSSLAGGLRWPSLCQGLCPPEKAVRVLGVAGSHASVGSIAAKKLRYASAQATYVLRRCFAEATAGKSAKTELETEIQEAGALIRFLQMARSTYVPGWVDDDT